MEGVGRVVLEVEGAGLVGVVLVGAGLVGVVLVGAGLVGALLVGALVVGVTRTGIELVAGAGNRPSDPAGVRERVGVREEECRGTTLSALTGPLDFVGTFAPLAGDCPLWEEL
jgi:hypothetical protein